MSRPSVNFIVDLAAFVAFVLLASTGLMLRWVVPRGGGGRRGLVGLSRHDWGDIHFDLALALLVLLAIHLLLHWRWIAGMLRGQGRGGRAGARTTKGLTGEGRR